MTDFSCQKNKLSDFCVEKTSLTREKRMHPTNSKMCNVIKKK